MSKEITLPSGATVKLKDPKSLRVKDRRAVFAASNEKTGTMAALSMVDGLIAILVEEWSFDLLIPSLDLSVLDDIEIPDYDVLAEEAAEARKIIFPNTAKTPETEKDPKAITADSKD